MSACIVTIPLSLSQITQSPWLIRSRSDILVPRKRRESIEIESKGLMGSDDAIEDFENTPSVMRRKTVWMRSGTT